MPRPIRAAAGPEFAREDAVCVRKRALEVEHIESTSVPAPGAKPRGALRRSRRLASPCGRVTNPAASPHRGNTSTSRNRRASCRCPIGDLKIQHHGPGRGGFAQPGRFPIAKRAGAKLARVPSAAGAVNSSQLSPADGLRRMACRTS